MFLNVILILLLVGNACVMLIARQWRWVLATLAVQYFLVFLLVAASWPLELAAVKLVGGWIAVAIQGLTRSSMDAPDEESNAFPSSPAFVGLTIGLVIVLVLGAAPALAGWSRQFGIDQAWAGLFLIGIGLLQVGVTSNLFRSTLGLLTLLSGFEILYAAIESSILVAGLLAILNLGVSLAGAYLLQTGNMEPHS